MTKYISGLLSLLFATCCFAGTYYVEPEGNNANDGSSWELAKADITETITAAGTGTHTINVAAGTYTETTYDYLRFLPSSQTVTLVAAGTVNISTTGSFGVFVTGTGNDITFDGDFRITTTSATVVRVVDGETSLTMTGGSLTSTHASPDYIVRMQGPDTDRDLTLTNVEIGASDLYGIEIEGANDITLTNCTFGDQKNAALNVTDTVDRIIIDQCSYASDVANKDSRIIELHDAINTGTGLTAYAELVKITNCTGSISSIAMIRTLVRQFVARGNTLTLFNDDNGAFTLGYEVDVTWTSGDPYTTNSDPFEYVEIAKNTLTFPTDGVNHCIFLGVGADNALILDNTLIQSGSGEPTLVFKSDGHMVIGNRIYAGNRALGMAGCKRCNILHNTIVSRGHAIAMVEHQEEIAPENNRIISNILVSTGTDEPVEYTQGVTDGSGWRNVFDRNIYHTGGTNIFDLGPSSYATVAALQAGWLSYTGADILASSNAANSVKADPMLADPANGDFSITFASPARGAAWWTNADIGASQRKEAAPRVFLRWDRWRR